MVQEEKRKPGRPPGSKSMSPLARRIVEREVTQFLNMPTDELVGRVRRQLERAGFPPITPSALNSIRSRMRRVTERKNGRKLPPGHMGRPKGLRRENT